MNWHESQRKDAVISSFNKAANKKTDINPNGVKIIKTWLKYMGLNIKKLYLFFEFTRTIKNRYFVMETDTPTG